MLLGVTVAHFFSQIFSDTILGKRPRESLPASFCKFSSTKKWVTVTPNGVDTGEERGAEGETQRGCGEGVSENPHLWKVYGLAEHMR